MQISQHTNCTKVAKNAPAPIPINIAIATLPAAKVIAKVAIAAKIVSTLVITNPIAFLHKQTGALSLPLNSAIDSKTINNSNTKAAIDNAIIIGVTIAVAVIVPKKNNTPIIIPNIAPKNAAMHPQLIDLHILALP